MEQLTAKQIVRNSGSNLAFALALLPRQQQRDMEIFYAFCRVIDDLAEDADLSKAERREGLDRWRNLIVNSKQPETPIEIEVIEMVQRRLLSIANLNAIIDGVERDIEPIRFATFEDLRGYCFQVASAVGLVSIEIFGTTEPASHVYAEQLGYALQLTNIMRDVREDAEQFRIYLPLDLLEEYQLSEDDILALKPDRGRFVDLMANMSLTAHSYYDTARENLCDRDKPHLASPELMRRIYFGILQKMDRGNYRVFDHRYRLSKPRMIAEFATSLLLG